ncbi:MAG: DNA mismatch repair endonuclease MutL [Oscillospiraceae bacterium]|nr:DNA mismatch repair endonuclease MutL [Oscillospiraceae bacterium]
MSVINILSPHVADLIAAGEVVERPASVIKELMENAIDAGAKNITVEISGGGRSLIRVSDDGCGMSPEDAGVAFLRHATSKLSDERGLESIATLGFRGEALAAISSVSRIELRTRRRGDSEGTRVLLAAGDIEDMGPIGCPEGTTMAVKDLFYNTPARLKFMKSDRAESSACINAALRSALGHPEVSVRMIRDGQEEFFTPGDGQAKSAVYSLLGRDMAMNMLECSCEDEGVKVEGFVSAPHACRGNRAMQFFFINGRPFRSLTIQAALEQAFKNNMLVGRFPACVLYISLGFGKVDVNVHPTKSEVKFSEEKKVFDCVYYAVLNTLSAASGAKTAEIKLSEGTKKSVQPKADFYQQMSVEQFRARQSNNAFKAPLEKGGSREAAGGIQSKPPISQSALATSHPPLKGGQSANIRAVTKAIFGETEKAAPPRMEAPKIVLRSPETEYAPSRTVPKPEIPVIKTESAVKAPLEKGGCHEVTGGIQSEPPIPQSAPTGSQPPLQGCLESTPDFRLVGEVMDTYIIVESEGAMLLIDKHAAHERMIFDRLHRDREAMSQSLLVPVTWRPDPASLEIIEENSEALERSGFEIEPYGAQEVIIRAVPADTEGSEIAMLEEIVEAMAKGKAENPMDSIFHTIACKAAIKAGWKTDRRELEVLAEKVISGEVRYCPHGRPVSVKLTRAELDKFFKRIV